MVTDPRDFKSCPSKNRQAANFPRSVKNVPHGRSGYDRTHREVENYTSERTLEGFRPMSIIHP